MTEFDKKLIEKADNFSRYHWREIYTLINIADTEEARDKLHEVMMGLRDLAYETL